jgi:hypothetical protein
MRGMLLLCGAAWLIGAALRLALLGDCVSMVILGGAAALLARRAAG